MELYKIIIGIKLAERLKLKVGKKLVIASNDIHGDMVEQLVRVKGIFATGAPETDGFLVQIPIGFARQLYGLGDDQVTQVGVVVTDVRSRDDVMEMAQAHCRLGARVTVLEMFRAFPRDDQELAELVITAIRRDGVELREGIAIDRVERDGDGVAVVLQGDAGEEIVRGSHLLIAAGRRPNVDGLGLEAAGVDYTPKGIKVDRRLRSTNKRIFAIGDVAGSFQFTHVAGYHAGIVIRNVLFRIPAKTDDSAVPWVTYTDPELASVGLSEAAARDAHGAGIRVLRWPFAENDRAQTDRVTDGFVKVITTPRGRILGAALVGDHAGELLQPWILAIGAKLKIGAMANIIAPYPTLGEVNKRAAGSFYIPKLFSNRTRAVIRMLRKLG